MIPSQSSKILQNSVYRRISASTKFLVFITTVLTFFIPVGFFGQLFIVPFIIICLGLAKLSKNTYLNIFKTFVITLILFILINWITLKDPIAIYYNGSNSILNGIGSMMNPSGMMLDSVSLGYDNNFYISNILGGGNVLSQSQIMDLATKMQGSPEVERWLKSINQTTLSDILTNKMGGDTPLNRALLYVINNPFKCDGVSYNVMQFKYLISEGFVHENVLYNPLGVVVYTTQWYSIGYLAFFKSLNITIKIVLTISAAVILTATTTPSELTNGIEKLFSPLKIIKFPANQCALILSLGIRFVPSLLIESKRILNAQASRGLDFYNGNIWIKLKSLVSLVVPLFTISINKSKELANAMDARGYNPEASRTKYRISKIGIYDYIYFMVALFITFLTIFMWIYKIVLLPFGIAEISVAF